MSFDSSRISGNTTVGNSTPTAPAETVGKTTVNGQVQMGKPSTSLLGRIKDFFFGNSTSATDQQRKIEKALVSTSKMLLKKLGAQEKAAASNLQTEVKTLMVCKKCLDTSERTAHLTAFKQKLEGCSSQEAQTALMKHMRSEESLSIKCKHAPDLVRAELAVIEEQIKTCKDPNQKLFLTQLSLAYKANLSNDPKEQVEITKQLLHNVHEHCSSAIQGFQKAIDTAEARIKGSSAESKTEAQKIINAAKKDIEQAGHTLLEKGQAAETSTKIYNEFFADLLSSPSAEKFARETRLNYAVDLGQQVSRLNLHVNKTMKEAFSDLMEPGASLDRQASKLMVLAGATTELLQIQQSQTRSFPLFRDIAAQTSKALNPRLSAKDQISEPNQNIGLGHTQLNEKLITLGSKAKTQREKQSWEGMRAKLAAEESMTFVIGQRGKERMDRFDSFTRLVKGFNEEHSTEKPVQTEEVGQSSEVDHGERTLENCQQWVTDTINWLSSADKTDVTPQVLGEIEANMKELKAEFGALDITKLQAALTTAQ